MLLVSKRTKEKTKTKKQIIPALREKKITLSRSREGQYFRYQTQLYGFTIACITNSILS